MWEERTLRLLATVFSGVVLWFGRERRDSAVAVCSAWLLLWFSLRILLVPRSLERISQTLS
jgi:hypothetical protein